MLSSESTNLFACAVLCERNNKIFALLKSSYKCSERSVLDPPSVSKENTYFHSIAHNFLDHNEREKNITSWIDHFKLIFEMTVRLI